MPLPETFLKKSSQELVKIAWDVSPQDAVGLDRLLRHRQALAEQQGVEALVAATQQLVGATEWLGKVTRWLVFVTAILGASAAIDVVLKIWKGAH